tara:strand:- start:180 stop:2297 length:2118 start_codon:yes stop_codon:yes gene_type:complete
MPGLIKYSTSNITESLRKGNTAIGVGEVPSSVVSTMNSTMDIPLGGYAVYTIGSNNNPKMWTANTGGDLLPIARTLGGNPTTVEDAIYYICSVSDAWIVSNNMSNIVTNDMVMNLDARNLSSYPGINSSFMDISGGNNNATLVNNPTFNSNGFLEFDGVDDYATVNSVTANLSGGNNNYTFTALIKGGSNSHHSVFSLNTSGGGNRILWMVYPNAMGVHISGWYQGTIAVDDNKWHHVVVTYEGTNNNALKTYVDGVIDQNRTGVNSLNILSSDQASMGMELDSANPSDFFNGNIAQVVAYHKTLSETEVLQNYYQSPITTDSLYFSIDANNLVSFENGSTIAYSLTGSVNGTISGATFDGSTGGSWVFGSNRNTYLKAGSNPGPFDFPGWDGYTVDIWVKRTAFGTWQSGGTTNYDGIWNYYWNHNLSFTGAHTGVNQIQGTGISGGYDIEMDTWYNVIMTHDNGSSVGNHKVYINGKLEFTANVSNATYSSGNPRQFFIGNWDSGWSMVGEIGNIQVYDRHLTDAEAFQNYNAVRDRFENIAPNPIETDGDYLKVFRHDSSTGDFFSSANSWAEARRTNDDNPQANKYSILNTVENYKLNSKYTFKLVYPKLGLHNIWSQRNNPVNDPGTGGVDSYVGIDIQMTSNSWGGLERLDSQNSTFLDGTVDSPNWYYAIGSKSWSGPTTFPGYSPPVDEVELWIKYK